MRRERVEGLNTSLSGTLVCHAGPCVLQPIVSLAQHLGVQGCPRHGCLCLAHEAPVLQVAADHVLLIRLAQLREGRLVECNLNYLLGVEFFRAIWFPLYKLI